MLSSFGLKSELKTKIDDISERTKNLLSMNDPEAITLAVYKLKCDVKNEMNAIHAINRKLVLVIS
jgi:hypothetical protein